MLRPPTISTTPQRVAVLGVLVIGVAVFINSLSGTFVFDDTGFLNDDYLAITSIQWLVSPDESPMKGRPLAGLTFVINYAIGGDRPVGYHLLNMLVHLACAVALFGVIRQTLMQQKFDAESTGTPTWFAFACAAIWMIHPLQTEVVNYISQRTESLAALCILASLYCTIRSRVANAPTRWVVFAAGASWAGVMCKEIAAVGPVLIVLYDLTFRSATPRSVLRERWPLYAVLFSSWIPLAALMYLLPRSETVGVNHHVTVVQYALNQCILICEYLRLAIWPDALLLDYGKPWQAAWTEALPSLAVVSSLAALTLAVYRRTPAIGYLGAWAFLLLAPTSSVIPINTEVGAERRMYLPLAGIVVLFVIGLRKLVCLLCTWTTEQRPVAKRVTVAASVLLVSAACALGIRTIDRNADYANPLKLWTQAVQQAPRNRRAWSNLATQFRNIDPDTSARVLEEIARRWPDDAKTHFEVAMHHRFKGNFLKAVDHFRRVAELDPVNIECRRRLVWLLAACADDEVRDGPEALRIALALHSKQPDSPEILDALAIAQAECGEFSSAIGSIELAMRKTRQAGNDTTGLQHRLASFTNSKPYRFGSSSLHKPQT